MKNILLKALAENQLTLATEAVDKLVTYLELMQKME